MKPMLLEKFTPEQAEILSNEWVLEQKYDGVRGYIKDGQLFDRREANITHKFPEFEGLDKVEGIIDGEIIAQSGEFNDISGRVHLKDQFVIKLASKKNPARFVAFDIVTKTIFEHRRRLLVERSKSFPEWLELAPQYDVDKFSELWDSVLVHGTEGLVAKRKDGLYEHRRSNSVRKIKNFKEAEATFTKLNKHTHGVRLETADGKSVNVNGAQAVEVEQIFQQHGKVKGEIQYMEQTNSGAWRFPSWIRLAEGDK